MAGFGGGLELHGAFNKLSDAQKKQKAVGRRAFIINKVVGNRAHQRWAYVVASRDEAAAFDFGGSSNPFATPKKSKARKGRAAKPRASSGRKKGRA